MALLLGMIEFTSREPLQQDVTVKWRGDNALSVVDDRHRRIRGAAPGCAIAKVVSPESEPADIQRRV